MINMSLHYIKADKYSNVLFILISQVGLLVGVELASTQREDEQTPL